APAQTWAAAELRERAAGANVAATSDSAGQADRTAADGIVVTMDSFLTGLASCLFSAVIEGESMSAVPRSGGSARWIRSGKRPNPCAGEARVSYSGGANHF